MNPPETSTRNGSSSPSVPSALGAGYSRRTALRAAGVTLAMPWLETLAARAASGANSVPPTRMACLLFPNGVRPKTWYPSRKGPLPAADALPEALRPIGPVAEDVLVLSGLANDQCKDAPHHRAIAGFLTGASPAAGKVHNGISADQFAAKRVGKFTRIESMQLGLPEVLQKQGSCDGYSCVYTRNISWGSPSTPIPKEINPQNVFDRLFRDLINQRSGVARDEKAVRIQKADRRSVLDQVLDQAKYLESSVSHADQQRLDQYLTAVRELEQRIDRVVQPEHHRGNWSPTIPDPLERPGSPTTIDDHIHAMMDLIALAFQTDSTRIATMMFGYGSSWNSYPQSGISEQHHTVSHYGEKSGKADRYTAINRYHVKCFSYLVQKLKSIREGDGTLLDHCMILFGSELGVGASHIVRDLPILLAGGGGGTLQTGRHLEFPTHTPMSNLLLEMLRRMQLGEEVTSFGESTGGLPGLGSV